MAEPPSTTDDVLPVHHLSFAFHGVSSAKLYGDVDNLSEYTSLEDSATVLYQNLSENSEEPPDSFADCTDFVEYCAVLIRGAVSGDWSKEDCLLKLKHHLDAYPGLASLIVDEIQISDYSTAESESAAVVQRFVELVTQIVTKNVVPMPESRERLEQEMLLAVGVSDKGSSWDTRYVRTKTKWFFKLQKFNLYREEPEGFAELIDVLDQASSGNSTLILEKIMELAGTYDLDIYRIVETILTAICLQPKILSIVLLDFCDSVDFDIGTLISLIGNKFQHYGKKTGFRRIHGLCQLVCFMVSEKLAAWDDILPYVPMLREDTEVHWKLMFERAVTEDKILHTNKRSVKEQFNNMENVSFDAMTQYFEEHRNPRIELITTMLQMGMYHDAIRLINEMPMQYATTFEPLALEIGKIVHYIIDPLYRNIGLDEQRVSEPASSFPSILNDQLPSQLTNAADIGEVLDPWLMLLGGNLIYDRALFTKLLRIAHGSVKPNEVVINQDFSMVDVAFSKVFRELLHIFEHCFLPALTRGTGSAALSEKIFAVMKMLPYTIRFTLYYKTKMDYYPHGHPLGIVARAIALSNAKWFQKRINKDNTKLCGRMVAKDMYNNGLVVCNYLSERIGAYDNFGTLVTEAMRNASAFAADVMLYCVLEYMTLPKNNNQKHDAMTIMPWYRYTANFSAVFAKRLTIELEPILEYVVGMLKAGQTVDLLILKELVHKLSGIEVSEGVTDEQLEALAGGEVLKAEGAYFSPMRNTKRSSVRLKDALLKSGQALPLCLLISHVESVILYKEDEGKNLKLVGLLYDMCHDTLVQYGTFLATNLTKSEYAENFPTLAELIRVYNIPFETSIFLLRSVYWNEISTEVENFKKQATIPDGTLSEEHFKLVQERFSKTFDSVISSVVDLIAPVMIQAPMEDISLRFYVLFWFLSLYDLYVPVAVYEQEVEKLQQVIALAHADQGDDDINTLYKRKKEGQRAQTVITRLQEEMSVQKQHVQMLRNHLAEEKDKWFQSAKTNKTDVVSQFLQMCVLPRSTFSTIDALFSAHFISSIHDLRTQNFSTLLCYDRMLCDITTALTCCSENEASRYGRLLHTVLQTIMRWHNSKAIFDMECQHHPGFMTKFRAPTISSGADVADHIDYENFRHVCHKWHFKLTKSMVKSLDSDCYVRIRNGLIVLDRILPYYPIISNFYIAIEKRVQQLMDSEKEKRPDMYSLAYGYMGRLRTQKASGHLVLEETFHTRAIGDFAIDNKCLVAGPKRPDSIKTEKNGESVKSEKSGVKEEPSSADDVLPASTDGGALQIPTPEKEKDITESSRKLVSALDIVKSESGVKKGGSSSATSKTSGIPSASLPVKTATAKLSTPAAKFVEKALFESDDKEVVRKRPKIPSQATKAGPELPTQNGTVKHNKHSTNGVKSEPASDKSEKIVFVEAPPAKLSRRTDKNGTKPGNGGKETKPADIPGLVLSDPEPTSRSSHPKKIRSSVSETPAAKSAATSSKVPEKEVAIVPSSKNRGGIREEKNLEIPRSPDVKILSKRTVADKPEKDRSRLSSSSQSPASRRSIDRPKEKTDKKSSVLSRGDMSSKAVIRSKEAHRHRSSVEVVSPELLVHHSKKSSSSHGVEKNRDKSSRTQSPEPVHRKSDKESLSHKSLRSPESSRELLEKKVDRDLAKVIPSSKDAAPRPVKRRRETDSVERERPHRKSSAAH